jgi:WD40 repeat protein/subtilisin-like proprotein convertase family protein
MPSHRGPLIQSAAVVTSAHAAEFFVVGGPVQPDRDCYVVRQADEELAQGIIDQHFCYVLGPRAIGKTSLMARTIRALRREGQLAAVVDLTQIGARSESTDAGRWYYSIAYRILRELRLKVDLQSWWQEKSALMSEQRLAEFFWDLVLTNTAAPVTVFFDEIERALELPFTDQLFAAIRACYARRATEPDFARLNFVVLGVAAPADLCPDVSLSPFAEGVAVELGDFTLEETYAFEAGLQGEKQRTRAVLERIYGWAGGQPYLTQKIARGVVRRSGRIEDVDRIVREQFLASGITQEEPLLNHIRTVLTERGPHHRQALLLLAKIAHRVPVFDEPGSAPRSVLKLSGIVAVDEEGRLDFANRIYRQVYTSRWVSSALPFNWRTAAVAAAAVLALVALPVWYTQVLPQPHIAALAAADSIDEAQNAHRRLRRLPGYARLADELMTERMVDRARVATSMAEVFSVANVLRRLPERALLADRILGEYWIERAREEMHRERRERALLYAIEAVPGLGAEARELASELIGTDLQQLRASFYLPAATARWEVDWQRDALTLIDARARARRLSLSEPLHLQGANDGQPPAARLTALQHQPLRRALSIDEAGAAGGFELILALSHPMPGDLLLTLEAPDGTAASFTLPALADRDEPLRMRAAPGSPLAALAARERQGVWRLTLVDRRAGAVGTLDGWGLAFAGAGAGDAEDAEYVDEPGRAVAIPDPEHTDLVELTVAPDGRFAATRPLRVASGAVGLWDLVSGERLADLQVQTMPERLVFNADASRLLALTDTTLTLWDTAAQIPVARLSSERGFALPPAISSDGAYVAVAEHTDGATPLLSLIRADTGVPVASVVGLAELSQWVLGAQARYLALLASGRSVRVMEPRRGEVLFELRHEREVERIFSVSGADLLVSVDAVGDIRVWPLNMRQRGAIESRLVGRTVDASGVALAPAAPVIAFEAAHGHVIVRDLESDAPPTTYRVERSGEPVILRLAADGRRLLTGRGNELRHWQVPVPTGELDPLAGELTVLTLDEQGRVAALGFRGGHVRVRSTSALERAPVAAATVDYIGHRGEVTSLAVGVEHSLIASGGADGVVRRWDLASVAPAPQFMRHPAGPVHAVAVSGTGRWIASAAQDAALVWRAEDGALSVEIPVNGTAVSAAFAPDSAMLAVGDTAGNVFLGEPDAPLSLRSARAQGAVRALAFTADGQWLASGDDAGSVQVWDAVTFEPIGAAHAFPHPVRWLRFTGSGLQLLVQTDHWIHRLAVSVDGLRVDRSRLLSLGIESGAAALSPDGERLRLVGGRGVGRPIVHDIELARPSAPPLDADIFTRDWAGLLGLTLGPMGMAFTLP